MQLNGSRTTTITGRDTKMDDKIPNPGSSKAVEQGCKCPVYDNHYGAGIPQLDGKSPLFWRSQGCPLHAIPTDSLKHKLDDRR